MVNLVEEVYYNSKGAYDRNWIKISLQHDFNINVSAKVIQGIMKQLDLKSLIRTSRIKREKRKYIQVEDLIKKIKTNTPKHNLFNGVSYIATSDSFAYLALTHDGYNNEVVGWSLSLVNDQHNVLNSFKTPLTESESEEIIVHTYHASAYHLDEVRKLFKRYGIRHFIGRVVVSLGNKPIEYMLSMIKRACIKVIETKL